MGKGTKKITLNLVLSWIFSIIFGISGLGFLFAGLILPGGSLILASLILLPSLNAFVKKQYDFELSGWLKIVLVIILLIFYSVNLPESVYSNDVNIAPTGNVIGQESNKIVPTQDTPINPPKEKIKSATISINKVQIQLANLYPARVTITNTGDVSISPKFDLYVYGSENNEICSGSPLFDEIDFIKVGESKTGEISILGCMFKEDGDYTLKVDLLDSDYNKLDSADKDFVVDYWSAFEF